MKIVITGRNVEITEALKEKVETKFKKISKFVSEEDELKVTFKIEGNDHVIETFLNAGGNVFKAVEKSENMYTSIDKVIDILELQIVKNKEKSEKKLRDSATKIKEFMNTPKSIKDEVLIKECKKYTLRPMSIEEAIFNMNNIEKDFFVFNNSETNEINLIYKIKDGGYGLIEPEI